MKLWLTTQVDTLVENIKTSPKQSFLQNILAILMIYQKMMMLGDFCYNSENAIYMSFMLRNMGVDTSTFQHTVNLMWDKYKEWLFNSISFLINCAIKCRPLLTEWIFAIPILYFLKRKCIPPKPLIEIHWDIDKDQ